MQEFARLMQDAERVRVYMITFAAVLVDAFVAVGDFRALGICWFVLFGGVQSSAGDVQALGICWFVPFGGVQSSDRGILVFVVRLRR